MTVVGFPRSMTSLAPGGWLGFQYRAGFLSCSTGSKYFEIHLGYFLRIEKLVLFHFLVSHYTDKSQPILKLLENELFSVRRYGMQTCNEHLNKTFGEIAFSVLLVKY